MKLSKKRTELLRKNVDKILGLKILKGEAEKFPEYSSNKCLYSYGDGTICAASACLTDREREDIIISGNNSKMIDSILKGGSDVQTLTAIQIMHDKGMENQDELEKLKKTIDELLDNTSD
jgi:hypothetical protein